MNLDLSCSGKSRFNQVANFPEIKTERLILREFKPTESIELLNILKEKDFIRFYDGHFDENQYYKDLTPTYIDNQLKYWKENYNRRTGIEWAIIDYLNKEIIGFIKVHRNGKIDTTHWYTEFAIKGNKRNNGYMKEALRSTLRWCKLNGLDEIRAMVELYNTPSIRLLDSLTKTKNLFQSKKHNNDLRQVWGYTMNL